MPFVLGKLEIQVLEFLWAYGDASVKTTFEQVGIPRGVTQNTVQSTLERLHKKGMLSRTKTGHAFVYAPLLSRTNLLGTLISSVLGRFSTDRHSSALAFIDAAQRIDDRTLDLLEKALEAHKKERSQP